MTANPWIRILQPRPNARQRLLIVPHAGGGPAYYRDWATHLPEWVEVVVVQLPGRASRWKEPAFTRMEPLLEELAPRLSGLLDRPITLFGHSLGALIAFELAKLWSAKKHDIHGLIVSGAAGPQYPRTKSPLYSLTDQALREELRNLGGTPAEVQDNDELFLLFLPTLRADLEILETYRHRATEQLSIPILVFGGNNDGWAHVDQLIAWARMTSARCDVRLHVGGHFFIVEQRERVISDVQQFLTTSTLTTARLDLWRLDLDATGDPKFLSDVERTRASRFIKPVIRDRFVSSHIQMRHILADALDVAPRDIALKTTDFGKPYLDPYVYSTDLRFNLSHSTNVGLLAITRGQEIGVDVEHIRPEIETADLARRYFSEREVFDLQQFRPADRSRRFFDYWSAKEAYIKARGRGLNIPLDEFDVPLTAGPGPFTVIDRHERAESGRWNVLPMRVNDNFAASICVPGPIGSIGLFSSPKRTPS